MRYLRLLIALRLMAGLASGAERLAVVSDAASEKVAALLAAELSKVKGVELVERAELDRVRRELALAKTGSLAGELRLAAGAHAAGILVVESTPAGEQATRARLVATAPGVIVGEGVFAGDASTAAAAMAARFRPLLPKLAVARGRAVPLSLLSLRGLQGGDVSRERQLNFLLARQLVQQPEFFVLERWRMDQLAWEKSLASEPAAFWSGSYLVEGTLDTSDRRLWKLQLFLRAPQGGSVKNFDLTGDPAQLPDLAARAAAELAKALTARSAPAPWRPLEEAAQYRREAEWALRARLWREARDASETAWALGAQETAMLVLRAKSESAVAFPPNDRPTVNWPLDYELEKVDPQSVGERLRSAAQAIALFDEWRAQAAKATSTEIAQLGTTVLLSGSRLLRYATEHLEILEAHRAAVDELRGQARATVGVIHALQPADETGDKGRFYLLTSVYLPFWYETPAEAVAAWREFLARRFSGVNRMNLYATVRQQLLDHGGGGEYGGVPWLVGWRGEGAEALIKQWEEFRSSLQKSENPIEVLDACILETAEVKGDGRVQQGPVVSRLHDQFWAAREAVLKEGLLYDYVWAIIVCGPGDYRTARPNLQKRWLLYYLDHTKRDDFRVMGTLWQVDWLTREEAGELLEHWLAHKKRLLKPDSYASSETRLFEKFPDLAGPPAADGIVVKQFWYPPELGDIEFEGASKPVWAEGRLWVIVKYSEWMRVDGKQHYHYRVLVLDLPSLQVIERIEGANDGFPGLLLVQPDALYLTHGKIGGDGLQFRRYDRKTKIWNTLPLPIQPYRSAYVDGDRLVAAYVNYEGVDESGIVQWTPSTNKTTILSSSRRRPALNQFDDRAQYEVNLVFPGPGGAIAAEIDDHGYTYNAATKRWDPFLPTFCLYANPLGAGTLLATKECGVGFLARGRGAIDPWFTSRFPNPKEPFTPAAPAEFGTITKWFGVMDPMAHAGGKLWMLHMKPAPGGLGEKMMLAAFDHERLVSDRPIRFEPPVEADQLYGKHVRASPTKAPVEPTFLRMVGTSAGIFFQDHRPGFWFLPLAEASGPGSKRP